MNGSSSFATQRPKEVPKDRLGSWKEIAVYLNRGERTVQRWEREQGLPVHRLVHNKRGSVFASARELDAWWASRSADLSVDDEPAPLGTKRPRRRATVIAGAIALAAITAIGIVLTRLDGKPANWDVRPLTTYRGSELYPSFSPDGSRLAFAWDGTDRSNFDIYTLGVDSTVPVRLTTAAAPDISPAWSPDGRWIAFVRLGPVGAEDSLYVIPAVGGPERRICALLVLFSTTRTTPLLSWTPDGRHIAAGMQSVVAGRTGIVLASVDGGKVREILGSKGEAAYYGTPAFSPDGKRLAFTRCRPFHSCNLYTVDLAAGFVPAGEPRRLTADGGFLNSPVWSADGRQILFSSGAPWDERTLASVGVNGNRGAVRTLHSAPGMQTLAVARDTGALAYSRETLDSDIWSIEMQAPGVTAGAMQRVIASTRPEESPDLAPDGAKVAFISNRSGNSEVWVAGRDGSNPVRLTSSGARHAGHPRWSPDGRRIVFTLQDAGESAICVVQAAGGVTDCLTGGKQIDTGPNWSRDGSSIYFLSQRGGTLDIWKMPAGGETAGRVVRITSNGAAGEAQESPDGSEVYYLRHEPGVWRASASGGGEKLLAGADAYLSLYAVRDGLYLVTIRNADDGTLSFLPYGSSTPVAVAPLPDPLGPITASADGRTVYFARLERGESDLMLARLR